MRFCGCLELAAHLPERFVFVGWRLLLKLAQQFRLCYVEAGALHSCKCSRL